MQDTIKQEEAILKIRQQMLNKMKSIEEFLIKNDIKYDIDVDSDYESNRAITIIIKSDEQEK